MGQIGKYVNVLHQVLDMSVMALDFNWSWREYNWVLKKLKRFREILEKCSLEMRSFSRDSDDNLTFGGCEILVSTVKLVRVRVEREQLKRTIGCRGLNVSGVFQWVLWGFRKLWIGLEWFWKIVYFFRTF